MMVSGALQALLLVSSLTIRANATDTRSDLHAPGMLLGEPLWCRDGAVAQCVCVRPRDLAATCTAPTCCPALKRYPRSVCGG